MKKGIRQPVAGRYRYDTREAGSARGLDAHANLPARRQATTPPAGVYEHAKQYKRQRTVTGRLLRDIERRMVAATKNADCPARTGVTVLAPATDGQEYVVRASRAGSGAHQ
jgi:hypothetical protein